MTDLCRYPGETFQQYQTRTGLDHWATTAEIRAATQEYIRDYVRANNSPDVVAWCEREWEKKDRGR